LKFNFVPVNSKEGKKNVIAFVTKKKKCDSSFDIWAMIHLDGSCCDATQLKDMQWARKTSPLELYRAPKFVSHLLFLSTFLLWTPEKTFVLSSSFSVLSPSPSPSPPPPPPPPPPPSTEHYQYSIIIIPSFEASTVVYNMSCDPTRFFVSVFGLEKSTAVGAICHGCTRSKWRRFPACSL